MSPATNEALEQDARSAAAAGRVTGMCLVVHDDLDLRLKLAGLVRRASASLDADTVGGSTLESLSIEQLRSYVAVLIIVEFMRRGGEADPLAVIGRLRARAPRLPIFVFARHGSERSAARAIRAGAVDYWPIHSVDLAEFSAALQPFVPSVRSGPATRAPDGAPLAEVAGYRVIKKIAQSAGATVYLAHNDDLAQPVALKVQAIKGKESLSEEDRQRFERECDILSSLNHRSIADVIDFGITPDCLYLALEYFPCGSLRERLKNPVSEADALNYARQIAEALRVVHAAGVVHGDLKPSNLMLTMDNRVVLIDFGSARAPLLAHDPSRSDLLTGTPYYVCPEQIEGVESDQRGDLYSLGIIFYEMLCGNLPFRGTSLEEIFQRHRTAAVPVLPAALARYQPLLGRLLEKQRDKRCSSAASFLEALDALGPPAPAAQPARRAAPRGALGS